MNSPRLQYLGRIVLIAAAYYAAGELGLAFSTVEHTVSPIWFPSGVAIAFLLLGGQSFWPGVFLGKFLLFTCHGFGAGTSLIAGAGAAMEAAVAVALLQRYTSMRGQIRTMSDLFGFFFCAVLAAPLVGTLIGLLSLILFDRLPFHAVGSAGLTWWSGDAMGTLTAAPILLAWFHPKKSKWDKARALEALALAATLAATLFVVFVKGLPGIGPHAPILFIVVPLQIWAALRFHERGATAVLFVVALASLAASHAGFGPLGVFAPEQRYWLLFLYLTIMAINAQVILVSHRQWTNAETSLRQTQARFRRIVETSPDLVWETNENQVYSYCSPRIQDLLGYTPEEMIGRSPLDFMPPDEAERVRSLLRPVRNPPNGHKPFDYTIQHFCLNKNNHRLFMETSAVPIFDEQGGFKGYCGIQRDITSRRNSERALMESEERFRSLMSNCPLVVAIKNEAGRIVYVNTAFEQAFGRTMNDCMGKDAFELFPESMAKEVQANDRAVLLSKQPFIVEEIEPRPEGSRHWMSYKFPLTTPLGSPLLASMSADITLEKRVEEQKAQLEAQLRQSQKMEAIGTLAGGIAHDFNNLLGVIIGYASAAQLALSENAEARADLEEALAAARQGKELVRQILTFSRKQEPKREPVRLSTVIEETLKMLRVTLPSGVMLETHIDPGCPPVEADRTQIQQVIMNLATNAIHAMNPNSGLLEISLEPVLLTEKDADLQPDLEPGPHVLFKVKDNGQGMPRAVLERIFDPFFTTKAVGSGTGLGLSVVQGIIKSHHGAIQVESTPGMGTVFRIYLPATSHALPEEKIKPAALTSSARVHGHILLIDDELKLAALNRRVLEKRGHRVTICHTSVDGWKKLQGNPGAYDLVITDQNLAKMTGLELATKVMELPGKKLRVILSSGCTDPSDFGPLEDSGVCEFLAKPYTPDALIETVEHWLSSPHV